jgi:sugar phosphate isomerase/epimerase
VRLSTSTNIYFEREGGDYIPIRETIARCAEAGYKYLDFGLPELLLHSEAFAGDSWKAEITAINEAAQAAGLTFVQAHATIFDFCNQPPGSEQEKYFERSLEAAAMLDIPWVVAHPSTKITGHRMDPATFAENVRFFRKYSDMADRLGTGIAIENMWGETPEGIRRFAIQPEELLQLVTEVGRTNVKICWDVGHGFLEDISQRRALELLKDHLAATHISDTSGRSSIHRLPYHGAIDWEEFLDALAAAGYSGPMSFELQHYLRRTPEALVQPALNYSVQVGEHLLARLASKNTSLSAREDADTL